MMHIHIVTEKSLEELQKMLPTGTAEKMTINRFRANIVLKNCPAWYEDTWSEVFIGNVLMRTGLYAWRCKLINVDNKTYEYDPKFEPVRTLRKQRAYDNSMRGCFGTWLMCDNAGSISIGDEVKVLKTHVSEVVPKDQLKKDE